MLHREDAGISQAETQVHLKYRPDIDGLRAIAVLSVVFFHASPSFVRGGFIGVDVFFVISGYLISTIIFQGLEKNTFRFSDFFARRIARIFPALTTVLLSVLTFGWFALLADEYKQLGKHIAASAAFVANLVLWSEVGYFDNSVETKPLLHLWSLGIEEQFYLVWPLILWLAWKRNLSLPVVILAFGVTSLAANLIGVRVDDVAAFYSPVTRFWELLSGSLLAWISLYWGVRPLGLGSRLDLITKRRTLGELSRNLSSILGLLLLAIGFSTIDKSHLFPGAWALLPVCGTTLVIAAGPTAWINQKILSRSWLVWIGLISYPLYLWHWPLLSFARIVQSDQPSLEIRVGAVLLSIGFAWVTRRWIEAPLRLSPAHRRLKITALMTALAILAVLGYLTFRKDGVPERESIRPYANNKNELIRTPATDEACFKYIGNSSPAFHYCRFSDAGGTQTVAVVGDSHAHVAYTGIAEALARKHINTVMLANSSCPPLLGTPIYGKTPADKSTCDKMMRELIDTVVAHKDIRIVLFFTRGPIYLTGTEPVTGDTDVMNGAAVSPDAFRMGMQRTINRLVAMGKKVYYVSENPELSRVAESCLPRPMRLSATDCSVAKSDTFKRQQDYLKLIRGLTNVRVIETIERFCPSEHCLVFAPSGSLFYADDDHLSAAGSRYQAEYVLSSILPEFDF